MSELLKDRGRSTIRGLPLRCKQVHMVSRHSLFLATAILAVSGVALAQPDPPPPPLPPPPPAPVPPPPGHLNAPHVNLDWNADHFHFDYDNGACHLVYDYNFANGDTHLDRHGDCSYVSVPRP